MLLGGIFVVFWPTLDGEDAFAGNEVWSNVVFVVALAPYALFSVLVRAAPLPLMRALPVDYRVCQSVNTGLHTQHPHVCALIYVWGVWYTSQTERAMHKWKVDLYGLAVFTSLYPLPLDLILLCHSLNSPAQSTAQRNII